MTDEQRIVYAQSMLVTAFIKCQGMVAENMQRQVLRQSMAYTEESFLTLIDEYTAYNTILKELLP